MIYIIVRPRPPRIDPKSRVGNAMDRIPNPDHAHPRPHRINPMNRFPRQSSPASRNDIYQTFFALKTRASPVFSYPAAGGGAGLGDIHSVTYREDTWILSSHTPKAPVV